MTEEEKNKSREEMHRHIKKREEEDLKTINDNFSYYEKDGTGKVICKTCGKSFSWNEWGKWRNVSLAFAGKHIAKAHHIGPYTWLSPIHSRSTFIEWTNKKSDEHEKKLIESAEHFKVGDTVFSAWGKEGTVIDIITKGHKEDFYLDKNNKQKIVIKDKERSTQSVCNTYELKHKK